MKRRSLIALVLAATALLAGKAQAAPIVGAQLFSTGGDVVATFSSQTAGFTSDLYVFSALDLTTPLPVTGATGAGFGGAPGLIFTNHTTPPGTTLNLGFFPAGTELVFGIYVQNTGEAFYMGPGARNPDLLPHAAVDSTPPIPPFSPNQAVVGFEDLLGGGDLDFDDLVFAFTNVRSVDPVPEPGTMLLFGIGGASALAKLRRRRAKPTA